jgi:hypothetical protein
LGKSYSGKKTHAQMLMDKVGASHVNIFDMGELIREALVYIDPGQQKDEAADPKAKKGAKGAPTDTGGADKYAGMDTTKYKECA